MSYTQEQIDRANQVDLEQFLRSHGDRSQKAEMSTDGNGMTV